MTPKPTAEQAISPARLHGEACFTCGRADGPLEDVGYIHTRSGRGELGWAVKGCPEHAATVSCPEHAKQCRQPADCAVCDDLDARQSEARSRWDYSAETDISVERRSHRAEGRCPRREEAR